MDVKTRAFALLEKLAEEQSKKKRLFLAGALGELLNQTFGESDVFTLEESFDPDPWDVKSEPFIRPEPFPHDETTEDGGVARESYTDGKED
jgi:hypothetical protein